MHGDELLVGFAFECGLAIGRQVVELLAECRGIGFVFFCVFRIELAELRSDESVAALACFGPSQ